jgi:rare lipoprotein A (peptidoglycan hydrolase)
MTMALKTYAVVLVLLAMACATSATIALASTGGTSGGAASSTGSATAGSTADGTTPATGAHGTTIATWFGPGLYGKHTACGQTLTPQVVGVANRTLPCGTLVKVTYAGHTLTVPVLDRGPYSHDASWDLTAGAAQALGISETVRIVSQVVGKVANGPTLGLPAGTSSASSTSTSTSSASGGALAG